MVAIFEAFQVSCERICLTNAEGVKGVHWVGQPTTSVQRNVRSSKSPKYSSRY